MNDQVIKVNLIPDTGTPAVVRVSQYDVGRPLLFKVLDGTTATAMPSGTTATIEGTKPSGLGFSVTGTLSLDTVTVDTNIDMTQESGMIAAEIRFTHGTTDIGTANFILAVEKTPHAEGTTDGTQETMANLETRLQGEIDGLDDRIEALEEGQSGGSGLTDDIKTALLQIARKVAYIDEHGQDYYDDLYDALYPPADLVSITAVYTPSGTVYESDSLDSLKSRLVVTAHWSNGTTSEVASADYTLSGTLTTGTSTVTVSYGGMTTTFDVTVVGLTGITATYTQSGTVYDTASLDDLKSDLVVTANYSDSTSETVTNYTLSGTLTEGTSVVTVSYGGKTASFNVAVSAAPGTGWTSGVPYDMTDGAMKNYYLNNGVETAYNGWDISPYMQCRGAFIISDTSFTLSYCAGYDSEDSYVQRVKVSQGIPTNYDALGCTSFRVSDTSSKVAGAVITPYKLPELSETTPYETSQYYAPSEWTEGGYVNTNTGAIAVNSGYKYSGYMNCYNASVLTDNIIQQNRSYAFYDGDKNFISGVDISTADTTQNKQTSIPSGARYFRASTVTGQYNLCFKFE